MGLILFLGTLEKRQIKALSEKKGLPISRQVNRTFSAVKSDGTEIGTFKA